MTTRRTQALRALLHDVCAADDAWSFGERWGDLGESPTRSHRLHVTVPPPSPFAALEITPWPRNVYGVVDVALRPGDTWTWTQVERRFGPFELTPVLESGAARFVATWEEPDLPATALLQAWVEGDRVASFTIRRDPRPRPVA
jgi:hypothetical protein